MAIGWVIADAASCVVVAPSWKACKAWAECRWQSSLSGEETASNQEGRTILTGLMAALRDGG